ncbi:MAG: hypothetical protein D6737_07245 [Chloroflexi bacterium]|nr:MAG: hypothetical protein D6737_07245 [Chloroflexota bacterium]
MRFKLLVSVIILLSLVAGVQAQDSATTFTVRIENVSGIALFDNAGSWNTPVGADAAGPALPGDSYTFTVNAEPGDYLSFATMFVQSNDLFFAPAANGLALWDMTGEPINGDVTDQIILWDAGTEVNEEPGAGPNQPPRQAGPNTGVDENGVVQPVDDDFEYPAVNEVIRVSLAHGDNGDVTVQIDNISGSSSVPTPITPGVWVVTSAEETPLFSEGEADRGQGLEALAEDGNPTILAAVLTGSDIETPLTPGVWVVHNSPAPLFENGEAERGLGLESLAEDGNPTMLAESLASGDFVATGIFNTPLGADEPGPLLPGNAYEFSVEGSPGDYLSFATMFVQSNDLFFAPDAVGIPLIDMDGSIADGDVTHYLTLWDAGTEFNEEPGAGPNQPPRQVGPNTGPAGSGVVRPVSEVGDGFSYPPVASIIRVTITANG